MQRFRSSLFTAVYFLSGIFWGTITLPMWVLPAMWRHSIIVYWTRFSIGWLKVCCGVGYEIKGKEHMDALTKPVVILSKHQSTWETLYLQGAFFPASTVLKQSLLRIPFFGWGLAALRPIAIDREDPIAALKKVKKEGVQRLEEGLNLILFPEGTRIEPGEKGKYARSGVDIAIKAGVDIIPIAHNAGVYWPTSKKTKRPGTITVSIGAPISIEGRKSKEVIAEVEEWIEGEMEKMLLE